MRRVAGALIAGALIVVTATPALAHVTVDPSAAPKGGELPIRFVVPNEAAAANTVKFDLAFPTDHPLLGVVVEPLAGWTSTVTEVKLNPPVQTDDGPVDQAVNEIAWTATSGVGNSGGGTGPGQFQEFPVLVQHLPTDVDQVVFKALQTYSDGSIVRWIDAVVAGQPAPGHPTPILMLTGPGGGVRAFAAGRADSTARRWAVIGVAVAALGLIVALGRRRRGRPE